MKVDKNYLSTTAFAGVTPTVKRPKPTTTNAKDAEKQRIDKMMALCRMYGINTDEVEALLQKKGL